jgi:hypothetical protein
MCVSILSTLHDSVCFIFHNKYRLTINLFASALTRNLRVTFQVTKGLPMWSQNHWCRRRLLLTGKVKGKAIPVTGRGGSCSCETSRLPHFLNDRLTDNGDVVSLTRRPSLTPRQIPGTNFCWRLSRPKGFSAAGRIRSTEKSNDIIGNQTRNLSACSIVPQPTTLPRATYY